MRPAGGQRGLRGRRARLPRRPLPRRRALIVLLGDTHLPRGTRQLPPECVRLLEKAELVLHLGDFTAGAVLEELQGYAPVQAVHGNMDEPLLKAELPERNVVESAGMRIGLVHDPGPRQGRHERLRAWFPSCDLVAYGHTHLPEVARAEETWIVNPGSPTERRRAAAHTLIVLERGQPHLVEVAR